MADADRQIPDAPGPRRAVYSNAALHRAQARHFLLFDLLPAMGTVVAFAGLPATSPHGVELALFFVFWLATGLGLTVGFHRYFAHRAFEAAPAVAHLLMALGSMAARGPMISWVAMHRRHHELSDRPGDVHSPNLGGAGALGLLRGWLHAHLTWIYRHDYPNVTRYVPDILANRAFMRWNRRYYFWVLLGLALPAAIGGLARWSWQGALGGLLWGGVVRLFVVAQTMSAVNSFCHLLGAKDFATGDNSRNVAWLGLASWGESHHNNHHAFPYSAAIGLKEGELDPGFWFVRLLERLGGASRVKTPSPEQIAARRAAGPRDEPAQPA